MHVQELRASEQGKFEERLPFLSVRVPRWFSERYTREAANLRLNSDRLTTPFDVHETLLDVVDMARLRDSVNTTRRSYSLFDNIPADRTCADADIKPHWSVFVSSLTASLSHVMSVTACENCCCWRLLPKVDRAYMSTGIIRT